MVVHIVSYRVSLGHDLVDKPLRDIKNLCWGIISDKFAYALKILVMRGRDISIRVSISEQDKHPLIPRLDHPHNTQPSEIGMVPVGLHNPVEIPLPRVHQMR